MDVFLRPEKTPEIAADAVRAGRKVLWMLWMQLGIQNEESRRIEEDSGLRTAASPSWKTGA